MREDGKQFLFRIHSFVRVENCSLAFKDNLSEFTQDAEVYNGNLDTIQRWRDAEGDSLLSKPLGGRRGEKEGIYSRSD